jgi:hypothetical protein
LALGAGCAMGLLLGLSFRVPALLAVSLARATVCLCAAPFTELKAMAMVANTLRC